VPSIHLHLPSVNAALNGLAAVCLLAGWVAVRRGRRTAHARCMIAALVCSAAFLITYLYYHYTAGSVRYTGTCLSRGVYFAILLTHTPLAALMTPFVALAVWHAAHGRFDRHTRITRWLWPVWMYVSVTGVAIYLMLYVF